MTDEQKNKDMMASATENSAKFLDEAEALSLKLIEEFMANKEGETDAVVGVLIMHFRATSELAMRIGTIINSITDGAITIDELHGLFSEAFMLSPTAEPSPIILLN